MNAIEENIWTRGFHTLAGLLPWQKAILSVSAHWFMPGTLVTGNEQPETIHENGRVRDRFCEVTGWTYLSMEELISELSVYIRGACEYFRLAVEPRTPWNLDRFVIARIARWSCHKSVCRHPEWSRHARILRHRLRSAAQRMVTGIRREGGRICDVRSLPAGEGVARTSCRWFSIIGRPLTLLLDAVRAVLDHDQVTAARARVAVQTAFGVSRDVGVPTGVRRNTPG